jgi:predicted MPP superfamily phosphohydrolase
MRVLPLTLFLIGHAFLWIGLVNRLHALAWAHRTIQRLTRWFFAAAAVIPVVMLYWWLGLGGPIGGPWAAIAGYAALCLGVAAVTLLRLAALRIAQRRPGVVRCRGREPVDVAGRQSAAADGPCARHWLARLPQNQILRLEVTRWEIEVRRLSPLLDGLSIAHLSDFHFTGRVGKGYFREVVRAANELRPDLVALTGDYVDRRPCLDWIGETLGELRARYGVFFVLGNHDLRVDSQRVRNLLGRSGFVDLGSQERQLEVRGAPLLLAGNEAPWFGRAKSSRPPREGRGEAKRSPLPLAEGRGPVVPLRIALAHCPDQLAWARRWNADLLLVGHTHGGQICIPPLGPIFSPCLHGVKYYSGIYHLPPTILHVTRGISADIPVRWNSQPEIALLTLRAHGAIRD